MIEGAAWPGESSVRQGLDALVGWRRRLALVFESQQQNALQATDVDQVEAERSCASGVQALCGIAIGESQQFLALAELGPRKRSLKQSLGELANVWSQLARVRDDAVRSAHRIGGSLDWIIVRVGRPTAFWLARVDLDQLASSVQLDQRAIATSLQLGAWRARRRRR